jgi:iron-sulfur cluster repair protein YtfE (RIC family)
MKVTVLLRNEHENLRSLFNRYKKPGTRNGNGKRELFNDIRREIMVHSQMELEIFYPALSGTSSTTAAELVNNAVAEHEAVEKKLQELGGMNPSDRNFEAKMTEVMDDVVRHIEMEEEEIFNEARKNLPEYRLEELGLEMEDRRKILTQLAA